ncbi:glycosyltransferase family 2 protein [Vibrio gigantis]
MSVAIITPIYNEEKNILKCYESIKRIEWEDIEWVIINDGSTDRSSEIINNLPKLKNIEIKLIEKENQGAFLARKSGVKATKKDFITILDCDDFLSEDAILACMKKFEDKVDLVCHQLIFKNAFNERPFVYSNNIWPIEGTVGFSQCIDRWGLHGVFIARKALLLKVYEELEKECYIKGNNINDDELFSKLCFYFSRYIDKSQGKYFYIENLTSTTRRFDEQFYRIGNTPLNLLTFIKENCIEFEFQAKKYVFSTASGLLLKYFKWYFKLTNKYQWEGMINSLLAVISGQEMRRIIMESEKKTKQLLKLIFIKSLLMVTRAKRVKE